MVKKELQIGDDTSKPQTLATTVLEGRGWSCTVYRGWGGGETRVKPQSLPDHARGSCRCTPSPGDTTAGTPTAYRIRPRRPAAPTPPPSTWQVWGLTSCCLEQAVPVPTPPYHPLLQMAVSTLPPNSVSPRPGWLWAHAGWGSSPALRAGQRSLWGSAGARSPSMSAGWWGYGWPLAGGGSALG